MSSAEQRQNRGMFLNSHKGLQFLTLIGKTWAVCSEYLTHWDKMAVIFVDYIFKCIFWNENAWISIKILLKFVPKNPINNIPALVQIMAWRRQGGKPLFEPTRTTRTPAFWGYPPRPRDYPYYWPVHFESQVHTIDQFISDPKSKEGESRKNYKNLRKNLNLIILL